MTSQALPIEKGQPSVSTAGPAKPIVQGSGPFHVTRNNGVSFNAADKVSVQTYIDAFTARIPPKEVISASRISNGRIAIYLSSREAVIDAVQQGLEYGDSFLELTPLVRPTTRLTLSNVYPEIPNSILVSNISSFCKVVSQIRPIPLGFKNKELTHIMSFRRQVQVLFNPNVTPPDHINFSYCNVNYRVFLSTESVRCFNCGEFGHISRSCKKHKNPDEHSDENNDTTSNPLNPPPVFVHNKKSDPKHPPKRSKPTPSDPAAAAAARPASGGPDAGSSKPTSGAPGPAAARSSIGGEVLTRASSPSSAGGSNEPSAGADADAPSGSKDRTTPSLTPSASLPQPSTPNPTNTFVSIWGSPPAPTRTFSDVVSKGKRTPPQTSSTPSQVHLITLKSPSPPRKLARVSSPMASDSPSLSQALDSQTPLSPTPSSTAMEQTTDTDSMWGEDTQTDDDLRAEHLPIPKGPLSETELINFLSSVKARKVPQKIARKFTNNIPGLVKQLKPLRNNPLLKKNLQQRIQKLVRTLDK